MKNGEFFQFREDEEGWEFAHSCASLNDTADCLDPQMLAYTPSYDFTPLPVPSAFSGNSSLSEDPNSCDLQLQALEQGLLAIPSDCTATGSAASCKAGVMQLLCHNETHARVMLDCMQLTRELC